MSGFTSGQSSPFDMNIIRVTLAGIIVIAPILAHAQDGRDSRPVHGVTVMAGVFEDERGNGERHPYVSARYERWLSRLVAFEGGLTHARAVRQVMPGQGQATVATPYSSGDLGLQLQLPLGPVRPYIGATIGGTYFHGGGYIGGDMGVTHALLAGARLGRFRNTSLRTELRLRRDDFGGVPAYNGEYGVGLTYNF
jgi:hypothetical protein